MGGQNYIRNKNGILFTPPGVNEINNFTGSENNTSITETILSSVLIPANSFKTYDIIEIESRLRKNNSNGAATIRIRIGTGQTTTDSLVATFSSTTISDSFIPIKRTLKITSATTTTQVINSSTSLSFDDEFSGSTLSDVTIDWTKNNYISVTGQLVSASDNMNCMYIKTKRFITP